MTEKLVDGIANLALMSHSFYQIIYNVFKKRHEVSVPIFLPYSLDTHWQVFYS